MNTQEKKVYPTNQYEAYSVIEQGIDIGQKNGVFTLEESAVIFQSIRLLREFLLKYAEDSKVQTQNVNETYELVTPQQE